MGNIFNVARPSPDKIVMATKFVNEAIAKNKVVIFSKTYCPYCTMAKEVILLDQKKKKKLNSFITQSDDLISFFYFAYFQCLPTFIIFALFSFHS